jgi:hypothetical protein
VREGRPVSKILILICIYVASLGIALLLALLAKHRVKAQERRTPQTGKLHHVPGQQLLERVSDQSDDDHETMLIIANGPIGLFLVWVTLRVDWSQFNFRMETLPLLIAAAGLVGWGYRKLIKSLEARQRAKDGLAAERMTAQQLNRLIGPECLVLHDIPADGFNLDHVVISPRAVYAIETKSFRKPKQTKEGESFKVRYDGKRLVFPDWSTEEPITQALRQAQWLQKWLRESLGSEIPVVPAVSLPGWWIDSDKGAGASDVRVFTPMGRGAQFMLSPPHALPSAQRALIAQALALRYPDAAA